MSNEIHIHVPKGAKLVIHYDEDETPAPQPSVNPNTTGGFPWWVMPTITPLPHPLMPPYVITCGTSSFTVQD